MLYDKFGWTCVGRHRLSVITHKYLLSEDITGVREDETLQWNRCVCVMDLKDLELQVDGVTRTFAEWTANYVNSYFPNVGRHCYRVPSLHFNQQKLHYDATLGYTLLDPPDPSLADGDLAHTVVLEKMEELSQQLRDRDGQPLFIISSMDYDNYLARLRPPRPRRRQRRKKSQGSLQGQHLPNENVRSEHCSDTGDLDKRAGEGHGIPTKQLPPRPCDRRGQRGELDIVLLHEACGVVVIEVKSTGIDSSWVVNDAERQAAVRCSVKKATKQLDTARDVLDFIMPDLCLPRVTLVIALPYVTRQQLDQALSGEAIDPECQFLCKDDIFPISEKRVEEKKIFDDKCEKDNFHSPNLLVWWDRIRPHVAGTFSLDTLKTMVGRICGLLSIVSVWTVSRPRVEVRTPSQAISEAGRRVSDVVLLPSQASILADKSLSRLCLSGPMGSGKTLLLQLKGRQWMKEGKRVVVINVRTMGRGRPAGHLLEEFIRRGAQVHQVNGGSVERHDIALDEFDMDTFQRELANGGPTDPICFLVDEVTENMSYLVQRFARHYIHSPIWCVTTYASIILETFRHLKLGAVLRSPPSVQLLLKELDLNPSHQHAYTTRSASRGLPCDGPPVIFIHHSKHNAGVRHLDCLQCAHELADILETKLGLQLQPQETGQNTSTTEVSNQTKDPGSSEDIYEPSIATESSPHISAHSGTKSNLSVKDASNLSFRDILILVSPPMAYYEQVAPGHWEPSLDNVFRYLMYLGTCKFLAGLRQRGLPYKAVVDDTRVEIALSTTDTAVLCNVHAVYSLERKVVIFIGGGPPFTETELSTNFSRYTIPHPPDIEPGNNLAPANQAASSPDPTSSEKEAAKDKYTNMRLFFSLLNNEQKVLCPSVAASIGLIDDETVLKTIIGNMFVAGTQSFITGTEYTKRWTRRLLLESQLVEHPPFLRIFMEIRGDIPTSHNSLSNTEPSSPRTQQHPGCRTASATNSLFLTPDADEDSETRQTELERIRQVLASLSMDDQDMQFIAASRCLSQYISILP